MDSSRSPGGTYFFFFGEPSSVERCLVFDPRRMQVCSPAPAAFLAVVPSPFRISFSYFLTVSGQPRCSHFVMACLMSAVDFKRSLLAW